MDVNQDRMAALLAAIDKVAQQSSAEDARNRPALEKLIRAIDAVTPELRDAPLVSQIADDILDLLYNELYYGLATHNPLRTAKAEKQRLLQRSARIRHADVNAKRRAVQDAWLALQRAGSRKSKDQFAAEQARALSLSAATVRRWLREGNLPKP